MEHDSGKLIRSARRYETRFGECFIALSIYLYLYLSLSIFVNYLGLENQMRCLPLYYNASWRYTLGEFSALIFGNKSLSARLIVFRRICCFRWNAFGFFSSLAKQTKFKPFHLKQQHIPLKTTGLSRHPDKKGKGVWTKIRAPKFVASSH